MIKEQFGWLFMLCGIGVVVLTMMSLTKALVVPRGYNTRLGRMIERGARIVFLSLARRRKDYAHKDRMMVLLGPAYVMAQLMIWLLALVVGYALILWPLIEGDLGIALRQSGSSLFTLGFASSDRPIPTAIGFAAAFTGLIVIALMIAYLPALYAAFNRRETLVTLLQSRGGSPAWGPEILARHQLVGTLGNLNDLYSEWEAWAADVAESHTNYPILIYFRSPHPLRSWVLGLLAVLDAAALHHALCPASAPSSARLCIRMGFTSLRDVAVATGIQHDPDPFPEDPIELTYEEFLGAVHRLTDGGFVTERTPEEAWPHFKGWRVNYEAVAYAIADRIVAPPGPWSGGRTHLPGAEMVPQRPADRRPGQTMEETRPRGHGTGL